MNDLDLSRDLTRDLRAATDHLAYTGQVPRPRPAVVTLAAPVAVAATATVVGWTALSGPGPEVAAPAPSSPTHAPSVAPQITLVTDTFELGGHTYSYQRAVDEPPLGADECAHGHQPTGDPQDRSCYVALDAVVTGIPEDAEPFEVGGDQLWVGMDPDWGMAAIYVQVDGTTYATLSKHRSLDQMRELAATMQAG